MRRTGSVILAVAVCVTLLVMAAGVHVQAGHCCAGECCPICPVIERALSVLDGILPAAERACALLLCVSVVCTVTFDCARRTARTLVTMKCELLD